MWMACDPWRMKQKLRLTYGSLLRKSLIGCILLVGTLLAYVASRQEPVLATARRKESVDTFSSPMLSTAIFLHVRSDSDATMLKEIARCMANVVLAVNDTAVHVFHAATVNLKKLNVPVGLGRVTFHVTEESDWVAFIEGLWMLKNNGVFFKSVLKLSTTDVILQPRTLEALCGSREHVKSILSTLDDPGPVMVAPMGTVFTPRAPPNKVCPHVKEALFSKMDAAAMLLAQNIASLDAALGLESGQKINISKNLLFATGSFWINRFALAGETWNNVERLRRGLRSLAAVHESPSLMKYTQDGWLPSSIQARGGTVRDIQPAPKVFAIYFPQYHRFPENDRFWGDGFTEWTLLRNLSLGPVPLRKPLGIENGGLGYYNLESFETRKQQAQLAREHGVSGFMFYHYWFSGKGAPKDHVVMQKIPELMLKDGQPDLPFILSWANEPWTRRWTGQGATADTLLAQEYGDEKEWREHFFYLLKFFKHPKYLRIQNAPVFAIYRLGHMKAVAKEMFSFWQMLARQNDLPNGLHLVHTLGGFYRFDKTEPVLKAADFQASFHFWPLACDSFGEMCPDGDKWQSKFASSLQDAPFGLGDKHRQYWGAFVGFDRRPRDHGFPPILRSPLQFNDSLRVTFQNLAEYKNRNVDLNLFFITAWNEWNEQAVLEPDTVFGKAYLEALKWNLERIPTSVSQN